MLDLTTLNREQLEAVLTTEGPLLVLAGAGSGKTRVITYRLAHLIGQGVSPKNILCVTFTNKAAFEMKTRAKGLVGPRIRGVTMSTFHALGVRILREHAERVGLKNTFTICDGGEQLGSVRRILRELRIDDRRFDAKRILVAISMAKNAGVDAKTFRDQEGSIRSRLGRDGPLAAPDPADLPDDDYKVAAIETYERYEQSLRAQNVVDFDDLLLLTVRLLSEHATVLERLQRRWRYVMIDEYQDTNGAQFSLMRLLSGLEKNLCVVGDDDQSIYGWRGADVENILLFARDFPGARVLKLEMNYRSTGNILSVANAIIVKNPKRHDKILKPSMGEGDPVRVVAVEDEDVEAEEVARSVLALIAEGVTPREIAVLFRSNVQSRAFELAFRAAHIPYRVVGGMDLFDKKEIKDALAYLRLLDNPDDEQSLRRILNFPPRGIGDTSVERIDGWARNLGIALPNALPRVYEVPDVSGKVQDAVTTFLALLESHRSLLRKGRKLRTVATKLLEASRLEEALLASSDSGSSASRRVENVREILRQIDRYESRQDGSKDGTTTLDEELEEDAPATGTLSGFLGELALGGWASGGTPQDREDQVVLSTIHAAKGLEWLHVFLVGVEEDLLPHARTVGGEGGLEEERRLAYVAVTRARKHLAISWAKTRTKWGRIVPRARSRFLDDLPDGAVVRTEGEIKKPRTDEERDTIAKKWIAQIRDKLGIREGA